MYWVHLESEITLNGMRMIFISWKERRVQISVIYLSRRRTACCSRDSAAMGSEPVSFRL